MSNNNNNPKVQVKLSSSINSKVNSWQKEMLGIDVLKSAKKNLPNNVLNCSVFTLSIESADNAALTHQSIHKEEEVDPARFSTLIRLPKHTLSDLRLAPEVENQVKKTVDFFLVRESICHEWGLNEIQPVQKKIISLHGPSGCGKSTLAEAIASRLGLNILVVHCADLLSKFYGTGPKNIKACFEAAKQKKVVLFFDEADTLVKKRSTQSLSGLEDAINAMTNQFLPELDEFKGVVIFATNLITNYDPSIIARATQIKLFLPDEEGRKQIWSRYLIPKLPLANDVVVEKLAKVKGVCGREIRDAVEEASCYAALRSQAEGKNPFEGVITLKDLLNAIEEQKKYHSLET